MTAERPLPPLVGLDEIRAAAATLRGIAVRTPLVPFGRPERRHWLKAESLQPIGAFKLRGAYTAAAALTPAERSRGLITYSSGNHAQGVARAARLFGVPAVIVMPSDAPALKRARVEADGAEVVIVGTASEERRRVAEEIAAARGLAIIPPYDDPRIVAGQGTAGLEIAEDMPDVAAVLVPIGGGGLASGVAAAIRALVPGRAGDRRGAGAGRRRAGVARSRADRGVAGGARVADDRGRHADAVDRASQLRPPVDAARRHRDGHRGGDRRRGPARGRGGAPGGGAVRGAARRGDALPRGRGRPAGPGRADRGRGLGRQRGPGPLSSRTSRRRSRRRASADGGAPRRAGTTSRDPHRIHGRHGTAGPRTSPDLPRTSSWWGPALPGRPLGAQ